MQVDVLRGVDVRLGVLALSPIRSILEAEPQVNTLGDVAVTAQPPAGFLAQLHEQPG